MPVQIRLFREDDWDAVRGIYLEGIATGLATFEHQAPTRDYWISGHIMSCSLVAEEDGQVIAFATLSPFSGRHVYRGVGELSIYVAEAARGRGVGSALMTRFIDVTEEEGFWTLQAKIFPQNEASIALHLKHGFRRVGYYEKIGMTHEGVWKDNIFLERRSRIVGI